jgi:hypothetical protein
MGKTRTKKGKGDDGWDEGDYSKSPSKASKNNVKPTTPDLSDALLALDSTNQSVEPLQEKLESAPPSSETSGSETEEGGMSKEKTADTLTARIELIKSIDSAYRRVKELEGKIAHKDITDKKINKLFFDLDNINKGLKELEGASMQEMAQRIENYMTRMEKIENRIASIKKDIKGMVGELTTEEKSGETATEQPEKEKNDVETEQISEQKIVKIINYLDDILKDGNTDSNYQEWSDILRTRLPEQENESERMKEKRKKFGKTMFEDTFKKVFEHLKLIHDQKQAETMIGLKTGAEKAKWEKRKQMLDEIFGEKTEAKIKSDNELKNDDKEFKERVIIKNEDDIKIGQILRLKRTSGQMEDGWIVYSILGEDVHVGKKTPDGIATKIVSSAELVEWNGPDGDIGIELQTKEEKAPEVKRDHIDKINNYFSQLNEALKEDDIEKAKNKYILISRELERQASELSADELKQFNDNLEKYKIIFEESPVEKSPLEKIPESPASDMFESALGDVEALREFNERIQRLSAELVEARNKLKEAFVKKEKVSGIVGKFKKVFGSKESEQANQEYEVAWNEYASLQKEMIEASQAQANELRQFLQNESNDLQAKIAEHYKGKENIISKVWKRLGEMNLGNYLEKKAAAVQAMEEQGEEIGRWDRFWANRAKELKHSNKLYKIGAKVLSVRLGLSVGLLGAGVFGIPGMAEARGAFVGLGSAMGSRHLEDAAQNKIQRWLGNRGEFYSSSEEAQKIMADKFGIVKKTFDEGAPADEPENKKTARRRAKFEKMLGKAESDLVKFESLPADKKIEKIQEKISAIEAYAYVNGLDLSKDQSYNQLILARESAMNEFLLERARETGDERPVIRPDSLEDAMAFLDSRKKELARTAEKVAGEKKLRWAKRLISVAVGAVSGTYAYFATLSRAELFGGKSEAAPVITTEVTEATETPIQPPADVEQPELTETGITEQMDFSEYAMVREGEGLERVLQRQLSADPKKFGFEGDIEDAQAVNKWVRREAHLIARQQNIADKYFVYNEKNPQFLILNDDKTVEVVGRLRHVSEIAKAKAVEAARLAQESAIEGAVEQTREGVTDVREVIDLMTGEPKVLTNIEQMEFNRLVNNDQFGEAMEYLMKNKVRGPIFETADGLQVHRAGIGGWEGNAPNIELPNGARVVFSDDMQLALPETPLSSPEAERAFNAKFAVEDISDPAVKAEIREHVLNATVEKIKAMEQALEQTHPDSPDHQAIIRTLKMQLNDFNIRTGREASEFFGKDFVNRINSEVPTPMSPEEPVAAQPVLEEVETEIFEPKPINTFDSRFGTIEFEYDDQGRPAQFKVPDNTTPRDFQVSFDRILAPTESNVDVSIGTSGLVRAIDVYDNIYVDMQNQGLQNTAEAGLIKDTIKRFSRLASKDLGKEPADLFNEDIVNRYNLKNK